MDVHLGNTSIIYPHLHSVLIKELKDLAKNYEETYNSLHSQLLTEYKYIL